MKALGLDLGSKRVGVAFSSGLLATPYEVIQRGRDHAADHARVIVLVEAEVDELRAALPVPVETYDERFTTVTAHQSLQERKMKADARRRVVDKVAAAVMLQSWVDTQASA